MNEQLLFRRAAAADIPRIMRIIARAQAQMRAAGSQQWQDGYPVESDIARDIGRGDGYVLSLPAADPAAGSAGSALPDRDSLPDMLPGGSAAGEAVAYGAAVFDGEPAYGAIDGAWLTGGDYVVLHRLAVADGEKGRGVAAEFMRRTEALARGRGVGSFRVDTNFDNRYMLRMLERLGFAYCGKIVYGSGERLAFEKPFEA